MKFKPLINSISKSVNEGRILTPYNKEILNNSSFKGKNEFLFFIKPEITLNDKQIKFEQILRLILEKLDEFRFQRKTVRVINAKYLKNHKIITQHYGVISQLSSNIREAITDSAKMVFENEFNIGFEEARVYGSIEFYKKFSFLTPTALSMLWQNSAFVKLAGGTYAQKINFDGEDIFLVNGFHPRQLEHYTTPGRTIVVMTLVSDTHWDIARNKLIGTTNPEDAADGSIRRELFEQKESLGLKNISPSWNGVHLSAGPVEALIELMRYNSDFEHDKTVQVNDFQFGNQLLEVFGEIKTKKILKNPIVDFEGNKNSVFDLTEEMNSNKAIELLKQAKF